MNYSEPSIEKSEIKKYFTAGIILSILTQFDSEIQELTTLIAIYYIFIFGFIGFFYLISILIGSVSNSTENFVITLVYLLIAVLSFFTTNKILYTLLDPVASIGFLLIIILTMGMGFLSYHTKNENQFPEGDNSEAEIWGKYPRGV